MSFLKTRRIISVLVPFIVFSGFAFGITPAKKKKAKKHSTLAASASLTTGNVVKTSYVARPTVSHLSRLPKKKIVFSPWNVPTFADSTEGDLVDGEDLVVRRAAVEAPALPPPPPFTPPTSTLPLTHHDSTTATINKFTPKKPNQS